MRAHDRLSAACCARRSSWITPAESMWKALRSSQMGAGEVGAGQMSAGEVGSADVSIGEVGAVEVR